MNKPIRIVFSETGDVGEITVFGQDLYVSKIIIAIAANNPTMVQLWIPAKYCDIKYDPDLVSDLLDKLELSDDAIQV